MKLVKTTNKCLECVCTYVCKYVCMYVCMYVTMNEIYLYVWPLKIDYQFYLLYKFHKHFSIPFVTIM